MLCGDVWHKRLTCHNCGVTVGIGDVHRLCVCVVHLYLYSVLYIIHA
jgi:hypothetical protein